MLKIDTAQSLLMPIQTVALSDAEISERSVLQRLIYTNPDSFFEQECKETLYLLNEEVSPSDIVGDRIDLLAIDAEGRTVIIELKRGNEKWQLLQAITYAAMTSELTWERVKAFTAENRREGLQRFLAENDLNEEPEDQSTILNAYQRIILIAESYDYGVLSTAQWLTDKWGLDITCYQVSLASDPSTEAQYLSAVQLFPAKPLALRARQRGALISQAANTPQSVEQKLERCVNVAVREMFPILLAKRHRRTADGTYIAFPPTGTMRMHVSPRQNYARVKQTGRFDGDVKQWKKTLSNPDVSITAGGNHLTFKLHNENDINAFISFIDANLRAIVWTRMAGETSDEG